MLVDMEGGMIIDYLSYLLRKMCKWLVSVVACVILMAQCNLAG